MPQPQLENPKGAFGHPGGTLTTGAQPSIQGPYGGEVHVFRNASTVQVIPRGAAVAWTTLSTLFGEVNISTVIGNRLFCGVAISSCGLNTDRTTVATAAGLGAIGTDYVQVQMSGPVYGALVTTGTTQGDILWMGNSTVAGSTGGGYLEPVAATHAAGLYAVAGIAGSSATTGTTGFLTTTGPRAVVWLRPSVTGPISTA